MSVTASVRKRIRRLTSRFAASTRPGRRALNAFRAARRDPDAPTASKRPPAAASVPEKPAATTPPPPQAVATPPGDGAHTAKDVTSVDPTKFQLVFYSQFGEDATIRGYFRRREEDRIRAEADATPSSSPIGDGFYVDIGCYHPSRFSNTMHFYDAGWNGINVDPSVGTTELFDSVRPRDTTVELAASETEGEVTFYTSGYGGRSVFNTIDPAQAVAYRESGRVSKHRKITVPALRLETILDRHLPEGQEISFLDIDVEGHDLEVLRSNNWTKYRPVLVVVESHLDTIDEVLTDPKYPYMIEQGYVLQSWVRPNMIFRRVDQ